DVTEALRRTGDEMICQRLGWFVGEEAGVSVREAVELCLDGIDDAPVRVADAGDRCASGGIEVALAGAVDHERAVAADCNRQVAARVAMKDAGAVGGHDTISSGR